ncbi:FAD-dependent oxidoreductase [Lacrimispora sp.]|uniref:FAD-dependent oxidoreductase n=1 Tax=Lacrimispora sp. TaxID=2719234 RepID=UPI0028AA1E17|nr:FAD-dependent oxidoreductase [Lacrimispora sp.]
MKIDIAAKSADIIREADVLVVGGGPAGIGAAVSAGQAGLKVLLLEKNGFLGGNITASYVETCNYFMKNTPFHSCGVYARMEAGYREKFGRSQDIRPNAPHRFNSENLKIYLDTFVHSAGVEILFHSFVNDVVLKNNRIEAVIIQTKQGPVAVKAGIVIDSTGDGDVAYSAGVPFEQGRDTDHLCQPGTLSFRVTGVNAALLMENGEDKLAEIGRKYKQDYRAGKTGLTCKRQDLPFGRMTAGGQISYVNYPCAYGIDPTDIADLSRGEEECRQYILEMVEYMSKNFVGMEHVELSSIATEICFRDSRRFVGRYKLTIEDMETDRWFDDVIAVYPRFYDMLAPDAEMDGDGSVEGKGYKGHIYVPIEGNRSFQIPYFSLIPEKIDNLLLSGRSISCDHVAQSGIRAISACMQTGEAAGAAAGIALKSGVAPVDVNIAELQNVLRTQGVILP